MSTPALTARDRLTSLQPGLIAIGVVAVALVIRLIGLGAESAWIDEAYSITLARYPLLQILQGTATDQHPPLYYLLLHVWMIFGSSVAYARLLSAILGTLNIIQVLIFGNKIGGGKLGIGAALLLAISPFHVWYSQEARQYMLLAVLTTAATIELWNCLHGRRRWWLYWIFSSLAIYTQYFAIFVLLAHAVIVILWSSQQHDRRPVIYWLASMVGLSAVFAPWLPTALNQFMNHTMPWIGEPAAGDLRDVVLRLLLGSGVLILPVMLRWVGLFALLGVILWIIYKYMPRQGETLQGILFVSLWALIPLFAISLTAIFYPIFQFKQYLIILVPALVAVVALALLIPRPWGGLFFAGLALAGGLTSGYQQAVLTKDDWRGVANYIESQQQPGDLIYANPAASSLALDLYGTSLPFEGYPRGYNILTGGWTGQPLTLQTADQLLTAATQAYRRVWLVEFGPALWDANGYIPAWLENHGKLLFDRFYGNIHLRLYQLSH